MKTRIVFSTFVVLGTLLLLLALTAYVSPTVASQKVAPKSFPKLRSGIVTIVRGQSARLNVVNAATNSTNVRALGALTANPGEVLAQSKFTLQPGISAFIAVNRDSVQTTYHGNSLPIRGEVTLIEDPDSACIATLEVFDNNTGKTTLLVQVQR